MKSTDDLLVQEGQTVKGPRFLLSWFGLVDAAMKQPQPSTYLLNTLMSLGWRPPNMDEDEGPTFGDLAYEVVEALLKANECPEDEKVGRQAHVLDLLEEYKAAKDKELE